MRDTIRHGGGVAERGESDWGRHDKTWGGVAERGERVRGGGESTAQRDKWGGLPGKEES